MTSPARSHGKTKALSIAITALAAACMWKYALFVASRWLPDSNVVTFGRVAWAGSLFVSGFLLAGWRKYRFWEWLIVGFLASGIVALEYVLRGLYFPETLPAKSYWFVSDPFDAAWEYFKGILLFTFVAILFFKLPFLVFRRIFGWWKRRDEKI